MKVVYDAQGFCEKFGGVSKYFSEILKIDENDYQYELFLKYSNNEYIKKLNIKTYSLLDNIRLPKKNRIYEILNLRNCIKNIKKTDAEIVHLTLYNPYIFRIKKNRRQIISTIHDLNFFAIPEFYSKKTKLIKKWQSECAKKSDFIITVSENTKSDLVKYLGIQTEKIKVIYHGINSDYRKTTDRSLVDFKYILFVGRRLSYKNFNNFINAFDKIKNDFSEIKIICTGDDFSKDEVKLFRRLNISSRIIHMAVSEKDLINLYTYAEFFIFPSFYEGFGMPLLEAFACECPVLCSNKSCFPEIAGNAALYFNPYSVENIAEKMNEILNNNVLRQQLVNNGKERVKEFSWEKSRKEHYELYKYILENKKYML